MLRTITKAITTDASGNATVVIGKNIRGYLHALFYRPGTLATGTDLTITVTGTGAPVLTKVNLGTGNSWLYPRALPTNANSATGPLGTVPTERIPIIDDTVTLVAAQGGNTLTGAIDLIWDDGRIS